MPQVQSFHLLFLGVILFGLTYTPGLIMRLNTCFRMIQESTIGEQMLNDASQPHLASREVFSHHNA